MKNQKILTVKHYFYFNKKPITCIKVLLQVYKHTELKLCSIGTDVKL